MSIFHENNLCNGLINISLRNNYVYFSIPKAASSTLKKTLANFELKDAPNVDLPPHPHYVHSPFVKPYQLSNQQLADILKDKKILKFTFVRNPYSRILAAYLSKILDAGELRSVILKRLGHSRDDSNIEVSFEQFVDVIVATMTRRKDRHWMPMSYILNYPSTKF